jgi:hypothetical protein
LRRLVLIINKIVGMASGSPWDFIHPAGTGKIKNTGGGDFLRPHGEKVARVFFSNPLHFGLSLLGR